MKARQLINVAKSLAGGQAPAEPFVRSAVNRAYYGAFGELGAYLRMRHYSRPSKQSPHDAAWRHLKSNMSDGNANRDARRRAIADLGFSLKARRLKADYRLGSRLARDEAKEAIEEADRIVEELDALDAAAGPP